MSAQPVGLSLSQPIMSCAHDQQAIAAVEDPTATVAQKWFAKGASYELGSGQKIDFVQACKCYEESAKQDDVDGLVRLAFFRAHGIGCTMDSADAQRLLNRAAELGSIKAVARLALFYHNKFKKNHRVEDRERATFYMRKVCEDKGIEMAAIRFIFSFEPGALEADLGTNALEERERIFTAKIQAVVQSVKEASEQGDIDALELLGEIYGDGLSSIVPRDPDRALVCFQRAIDLGSTRAFETLSRLLTVGVRHLPVDTALIRRWTEMAENDRHSGAQYLMGRLFWAGVGVEKDNEEAARYFRMAAEGGIYAAVYHLHELEVFHRPNLVQPGEDLRWATIAAEQKDPTGMHELGLLYARGVVVEKDIQKAMDYFRTAFSLGCVDAGDQLCAILSKGEQVPQDMRAASEIARELNGRGYEGNHLMYRLRIK